MIDTPSQEYLKECFSYDEKTGDLTWKPRPLHHFSCEGYRFSHEIRFSGHLIRSKDSSGYYTVMVKRRQYKAHRIIWTMLNGQIPEGMQIDHINGDRTINTPENLRAVPCALNSRNKKMRKDNKTGVNGVCWDEFHKKYDASLTFNGKQLRIGRYSTVQQAKEALELYASDRMNEGYTARHCQ